MRIRAPRIAAVCVLVLTASVLAPGAATALAGQHGERGYALRAGVLTGPGEPSGPGERGGAGGSGEPGAVAEASAERLELADEVAAAKYGTDSPIDDPAREREVLEEVAVRARGLGIAPWRAVAVFRDQIEANKAVQRGLHAHWDAHPEDRPAHRPDLAGTVRPALDRLTTTLLNGLRAIQEVRKEPVCGAQLALGGVRAARVRHFDALHTVALTRAVRSVC